MYIVFVYIIRLSKEISTLIIIYICFSVHLHVSHGKEVRLETGVSLHKRVRKEAAYWIIKEAVETTPN